jgi:hypothetical protein
MHKYRTDFSVNLSTLDRYDGDAVVVLEDVIPGHRLSVYADEVIHLVTARHVLGEEFLNSHAFLKIDIIRKTCSDVVDE